MAKPKILFYVLIRSWCDVLLDKFTIEAETKADVEKETRTLIRERGYYKATFKIRKGGLDESSPYNIGGKNVKTLR